MQRGSRQVADCARTFGGNGPRRSIRVRVDATQRGHSRPWLMSPIRPRFLEMQSTSTEGFITCGTVLYATVRPSSCFGDDRKSPHTIRPLCTNSESRMQFNTRPAMPTCFHDMHWCEIPPGTFSACTVLIAANRLLATARASVLNSQQRWRLLGALA